jgi:hypothetical protein
VSVIPDDLAAFCDSGVSVLAGSASRRLVPTVMRAIAVRVEGDRRHVRLFVADATSARTLADLRENPRIAITVSKVTTYRTVQMKGEVLSITAEAEPGAAEYVDRARAAFAEDLERIGMPGRHTRRLALLPFHEVRVRVDALFVQTPGPGAGKPLAS